MRRAWQALSRLVHAIVNWRYFKPAVFVACAIPLVATYIGNGLALEQSDALPNHLAVTGVALAILGAQLFVFTLLLHGTVVATTRGRPSMPRSG